MTYFTNLQEICDGKLSIFEDVFPLPISSEEIDMKNAFIHPPFSSVYMQRILDLQLVAFQMGLEIIDFNFSYQVPFPDQATGKIMGKWRKKKEEEI